MDRTTIPPTYELYNRHQLVERHPNLFTDARLQWAFRHREINGLKDIIFVTRSGELVAHEPLLLQWYLGLRGRAKPRSKRRNDPSTRRSLKGSSRTI
jgi:hypothetical protein